MSDGSYYLASASNFGDGWEAEPDETVIELDEPVPTPTIREEVAG
jgi:hypothetical protein